MAQQCELLAGCGFLKKYGRSKSLECTSFMKEYCTGYKQDKCRRKKYRENHGKPPSDDMRPDGHMMNLI